MELYFTISPAVASDRRDEVITALQAILPDSVVQLNTDGTALRARLPETTDRFAAVDALTFRMQSFGFTAAEVRRVASNTNGYVPPIMQMKKQPRTVRLSEAPSFGQPINYYDPSSRGAAAYRAVAEELIGTVRR